MLKRRKEIHKEILQPEQDNPKDISYRGKGLSNEYRLSVASGLTGTCEATSYKRLFETPKDQILSKDVR